jgi:hypothetical protein
VSQPLDDVDTVKARIDERVRLGLVFRNIVVVDSRGRTCRLDHDGMITDPAARKLFQLWYAEEAEQAIRDNAATED